MNNKDDEGEEHGAPWAEIIVFEELFFALLGVVPPVVFIVAVLVAVVLPVAKHDHGSPNDYTQLQDLHQDDGCGGSRQELGCVLVLGDCGEPRQLSASPDHGGDQEDYSSEEEPVGRFVRTFVLGVVTPPDHQALDDDVKHEAAGKTRVDAGT